MTDQATPAKVRLTDGLGARRSRAVAGLANRHPGRRLVPGGLSATLARRAGIGRLTIEFS